jgi:hypothetical protein
MEIRSENFGALFETFTFRINSQFGREKRTHKIPHTCCSTHSLPRHSLHPRTIMVDAKKLFQDLPADVREQLYKQVYKHETPKERTKKQVVEDLSNGVERIGFKRLVGNLKVVDAQTICETLGIDFKVYFPSRQFTKRKQQRKQIRVNDACSIK